jgi:hypothetical protein
LRVDHISVETSAPFVTRGFTASEDCGMLSAPIHIAVISKFPFQLCPCRCKDNNTLCDWHCISNQGVDDSEPHCRVTWIRHVIHSWGLGMSTTVYQHTG